MDRNGQWKSGRKSMVLTGQNAPIRCCNDYAAQSDAIVTGMGLVPRWTTQAWRFVCIGQRKPRSRPQKRSSSTSRPSWTPHCLIFQSKISISKQASLCVLCWRWLEIVAFMKHWRKRCNESRFSPRGDRRPFRLVRRDWETARLTLRSTKSC